MNHEEDRSRVEIAANPTADLAMNTITVRVPGQQLPRVYAG